MIQVFERNLRIVVLRCPYANWKNKETQTLFCKMVSLKLDGYHDKHFFGVMPIDGTDFVTDHILICTEAPDGELTPILGVKSLPYDFCEPFFTSFTLEAFLKRDGLVRHLESLNRILRNCSAQNRRISYYSSWTIASHIAKVRARVDFLKELFTACTVLHHKEEGIAELLGLGVPRFRTDEFFFRWGFERMALDGEPLVNVPIQFLGGIDGVVIHLRDYSTYALQCAEKFQVLWEQRLSLGSPPLFDKTVKPRSAPTIRTAPARTIGMRRSAFEPKSH